MGISDSGKGGITRPTCSRVLEGLCFFILQRGEGGGVGGGLGDLRALQQGYAWCAQDNSLQIRPVQNAPTNPSNHTGAGREEKTQGGAVRW